MPARAVLLAGGARMPDAAWPPRWSGPCGRWYWGGVTVLARRTARAFRQGLLTSAFAGHSARARLGRTRAQRAAIGPALLTASLMTAPTARAQPAQGDAPPTARAQPAPQGDAPPAARAQPTPQGDAAPTARAQPTPQGDAAPTARGQLDLRWDAPPGCPRGDEVLDRIRALAGSSLDETVGLSAEGRIWRVDGRFHLTLLVREGPDVRKRVIASDSCVDLAGAAAVTLALLLGIDVRTAERRADEQAAAPPKQGVTAAERSADGSDEERRDRSDERRGRWAVVVRAPVFAADWGPLPRPSLGAGLGVGMRYEAWRVLLVGYLSAHQDITAPELDGGVGAELQRMMGRLVACHGWRSLRFEVAPCVGLALEHIAARGFGEGVSPHTRRTVWPAPCVGAVAHWYALESLAFLAGASGYLELSRPQLVIDGVGKVAQLAPAAAGATVGLEWIF